MRFPIAAVSGSMPWVRTILVAATATVALAGCKTTGEPGAQVAGWSLIDSSERHPILVSRQPSTLSVRVPSGSQGFSPGQKAQILDYLERYTSGRGNGRLIIAVPSGTANETAAMRAIGDLRHALADFGLSEASVSIQPYHERHDPNAPIRFSYLRFVAQGPECGRWPTNLANEPYNLAYPNFGCAQQHNLAAQIANPADLMGSRAMDPADAERRAVVFQNYEKGKPTAAEKSADERVQVRGTN
jgi:pilus assembly protein CpaD